MRKPESILRVVDETTERFGHIDFLISNAGTSRGAPIEEMKLEHWNKVGFLTAPPKGKGALRCFPRCFPGGFQAKVRTLRSA